MLAATMYDHVDHECSASASTVGNGHIAGAASEAFNCLRGKHVTVGLVQGGVTDLLDGHCPKRSDRQLGQDLMQSSGPKAAISSTPVALTGGTQAPR